MNSHAGAWELDKYIVVSQDTLFQVQQNLNFFIGNYGLLIFNR